MIKKLFGALALSLSFSAAALAADGGYPLDRAPKHVSDVASLQSGAKYFVNYCLSCHSANAMRYNKLNDIGLTDDEISENLLFTSEKVGDLMTIAMRKDDATKWFGAAPPDLSVTARALSENLGASGTDYIYTYLRTFYRDVNRPTGWDNLVFPSVGMPHVLWQEQGPVRMEHKKIEKVTDEKGYEFWKQTITHYDEHGFSTVDSQILADYTGDKVDSKRLVAVDEGQQKAYDLAVADLSNFMNWMAEPMQQERKTIGYFVLAFLLFFFFVAWRLNKAYWKDIK